LILASSACRIAARSGSNWLPRGNQMPPVHFGGKNASLGRNKCFTCCSKAVSGNLNGCEGRMMNLLKFIAKNVQMPALASNMVVNNLG
jgi:hypothetical protein